MNSKPLNRLVVFRLSQEEYRTLKDACDRQGARNLSDFTRSEVLTHIQTDACDNVLHRRAACIEQKLAAVKSQIDQLIQGAIYAEPKPQP
jgi:hypothetical protein